MSPLVAGNLEVTMGLLVDDIWSHPSALALLTPPSKTDARSVFARVGFTGAGLDVALGVAYAESEGYADAVGDLSLIGDKWGPSIGLFQVRSLRSPLGFAVEDRYRFAWALRDPDFNALAAFVLSKGGTDWSKWSTFNHDTYLPHVGKTFTIRVGHSRAGDWNK